MREAKRRGNLSTDTIDHRPKNLDLIKPLIPDYGFIKYVEDRLGHDKRYAIDNTKITTELGWSPSYTFEQGMKETIEWYLNNKKMDGQCN